MESNVTDLKRKNRHTPEEVQKFIDTVFHNGVADNAAILFWRSRPGRPLGYPFDEDTAHNEMKKERRPYAWYYGTSSVFGPDEKGKLFNTQKNFSELHVLILDDIGTKINVNTLPPEFQNPSYIIESSPGNFQYGLILDKPLNNLDQARALIQTVYASGFTDAGGKMPNKLVRLPFGVHGKADEDDGFQVRLVSLTDRQFSPEKIISLCDVGYTWPQIVADPRVADVNPVRRSIGAAAWNTECTPLTTDGSTDVLCEYFIRNNKIVSYTDNWITVQCPWHLEHTTGDDTAGYSPLGYGEGRLRDCRGFKCFHEHCNDRTARDLIEQLVHEEALPYSLPVFDPVWKWKTQWVFDKHTQEAVNIHSSERVKRGDFKYSYSARTEGKNPRFKADIFLESPDKVSVLGSRYNPVKPRPIYEDHGGSWLNTFTPPNWGDGDYNQDYADTFLNHLAVLCPNPVERGYFINWICCKVNNPAFRGAGIIMTTPTYGTGRDTLGRMLSLILGAPNITNIQSEELLYGTNNDFLEHQLVICNELTDGDRRKGYYKAFEKLKEIIDPQSKKTRINTKYVKQYDVEVFASFLLFSNHQDVLPVAANDRRLYVISNTVTTQSGEYFDRLHTELSSVADWGRHVYRYLRQLKPDFSLAHRPAPLTHGKDRMINTARSPDQQHLMCILNVLGSDLVIISHVIDFICRTDKIRNLFCDGIMTMQRTRALRRALRGLTVGTTDEVGTIWYDGRVRRTRVRVNPVSQAHLIPPECRSPAEEVDLKHTRARLRERYDKMLALDSDFIDAIVNDINDDMDQ